MYNRVLRDSVGTKAFYIQIHFYLSGTRNPAAPIIFHDFLSFSDVLFCSPINFSLFSSFTFPEKKKVMLFYPPLQTLFLLAVFSNSDQQQEHLPNFHISPLFTAYIPQALRILIKPWNCQNT